MRIIVFSPFYTKRELTKSFSLFFKTLDKLQKRKIVFYDFVTDIDDFDYHCFMRHYNIAYIFYEEEIKYKYLNSLKWIKKDFNYNLDIYFLMDPDFVKDVSFKDALLKKYSAKAFFYSDKDIRKEVKLNNLSEIILEIINRKMFNIPSFFEFDFHKKQIFYINEFAERIFLPFKKKIDFNVMHCFSLNVNKLLSIEQIINFSSLVPENTNNLIIENSITSIRRTLQEMNLLSKMDILSKKKKGYIFSLT